MYALRSRGSMYERGGRERRERRRSRILMRDISIMIIAIVPVSISNMSMPRDHQSTAVPCPSYLITSGAIYCSVPQNVFVRSSTPSAGAEVQHS